MDHVINMELETLYNHFFCDYINVLENHSIGGNAITNPYFLKLDGKAYDDSLLKGVIFGKETNHWGSEIPDSQLSPCSLLKLYDSFVNKQWGDDNLFWQYVSALREWSRDIMEDLIYFIPNNISKVGNRGIGTNRAVFDYITKPSEIILKELSIINPDFLIFLNGDEAYDYYMEQAIGPFDTIHTELDRVYYIRFHDCDVPSLRLDHPQYLNGTSRWNETLIFIKNFVMNQLKERYATNA